MKAGLILFKNISSAKNCDVTLSITAEAATDNYSGVKDYWYEFYYTDTTGEHSLAAGYTANNIVTDMICTLTSANKLSVTTGDTTFKRTYYLRVKVIDNALNESASVSSTGLACNLSNVSYLFYIYIVIRV